TPVDGFHHQHHPRTAAIGIIVHRTMAVGSVGTQVNHVDFDESLGDGPLDNRVTEGAFEKFGQARDDIDVHFRSVVEVETPVREVHNDGLFLGVHDLNKWSVYRDKYLTLTVLHNDQPTGACISHFAHGA